MDVRRRESQKMKSSIDQPVLPSVVIDQALAVVAAIELNNQPRGGIVEVGSAQKLLVGVAEIGLNFWAWQAGLDQEPAKPGFHRRLGAGGNPDERAKAIRALPPS